MGWCVRHQVKKTTSWIKLCKRDQAAYVANLAAGEKIKPSLWTQWEEGIGPGQVKPVAQFVQPISPTGGVGTELKRIFKTFRIYAQPNCMCEQRAREMDSNGIEWCEEHVEEIADWLEEESKRRHLPSHLPFVRLAARVLIRRAIKNAKRKAK